MNNQKQFLITALVLIFDLTAQTSLLVAISSILETETFYDVFYQVGAVT